MNVVDHLHQNLEALNKIAIKCGVIHDSFGQILFEIIFGILTVCILIAIINLIWVAVKKRAIHKIDFVPLIFIVFFTCIAGAVYYVCPAAHMSVLRMDKDNGECVEKAVHQLEASLQQDKDVAEREH